MNQPTELYPRDGLASSSGKVETFSRWVVLDTEFQIEMLRISLDVMREYGEYFETPKQPHPHPV
jgi:hypothetical protein